tara:strand:- start:3667 stop:3912 length:246 start_codon:yes stop_codon:yes gene_type:complete
MILPSVLVKAYGVITFIVVVEEVWNINNPRPYPKKDYYMMQWEKKDFYSNKINGQWKLRRHRKTDSKLKKNARKRHYGRKY